VPNVRVREARPGDAPAATALLGELGYPAAPDAVQERIERLLSSDADHLIVADVDGEVAGLASLHVSLALEYDEPAGKLSAIVVDERFRRRGVGAALADAIEAEARRRGCGLLFVTTNERRKDAHAFYRAIGFEETGRRFAKPLAGG
jgi:GNAT superfamily N-acetyltransferase